MARTGGVHAPQGPRHSPTVGSYERGVSYERRTPVPGGSVDDRQLDV